MRTLLFLLPFSFALAGAADVEIIRLPDDAMQPRSVAGPGGNTHLVYLQGQPASCDVFVATVRQGGALDNARKISTPESMAVALGTVRGPTLAAGVSGVRHVLWSGANGTAAGGKGSALFYSRVDAYFNASPPRDMMCETVALDGGAAVASDGQGRVWIVWHAATQAGLGEADRRLFVRLSTDDGQTFGAAWTPKGETFGVCACCGIAAAASNGGSLTILYRTAFDGNERGARLIELPPGADANSPPALLAKDEWNLAACPMTTAECRHAAKGISVQWVRDFHLQSWAGTLTSDDGTGSRNHPRSVFNAQGEELRTWVEGSGWNKAGTLHWQVFARDGSATSLHGSARCRLWSYGAPFVRDDGRWGIAY